VRARARVSGLQPPVLAGLPWPLASAKYGKPRNFRIREIRLKTSAKYGKNIREIRNSQKSVDNYRKHPRNTAGNILEIR
jgi:hypothetical protein